MERLQVYLMSIQISQEQMSYLEEILSSFLAKESIEISVPVDIFKVATDLGFDVRGAEFPKKLDGLLIVNEYEDKLEGFDSNKVIAYNCQKSIQNKKFIVAHELAHYIYAKSNATESKIIIAARDHVNNYSGNENEQMMDYLAASLLIPKEHLKKNLNSDIENIREQYNVSPSLLNRRIKEVQND